MSLYHRVFEAKDIGAEDDQPDEELLRLHKKFSGKPPERFVPRESRRDYFPLRPKVRPSTKNWKAIAAKRQKELDPDNKKWGMDDFPLFK